MQILLEILVFGGSQVRLFFVVLLIVGMWCREQKNVVGFRKIQVGQCQLVKEERLVEDMVWEERARGGVVIYNCSIMFIRDKFIRYILNQVQRYFFRYFLYNSGLKGGFFNF